MITMELFLPLEGDKFNTMESHNASSDPNAAVYLPNLGVLVSWFLVIFSIRRGLKPFFSPICELKGVWPDHFWIHPLKWSLWYQMKAPVFLIAPVKCYLQQMLLVKVINENVA